MHVFDLTAVASALWGLLNFLTVATGGWSRPNLWGTLYLLGALIAGFATFGMAGLDADWPSLCAGFGALNHLSAALVYVARGRRARR